jgi:hypothetical protein
MMELDRAETWARRAEQYFLDQKVDEASYAADISKAWSDIAHERMHAVELEMDRANFNAEQERQKQLERMKKREFSTMDQFIAGDSIGRTA